MPGFICLPSDPKRLAIWGKGPDGRPILIGALSGPAIAGNNLKPPECCMQLLSQNRDVDLAGRRSTFLRNPTLLTGKRQREPIAPEVQVTRLIDCSPAAFGFAAPDLLL
jgi:hypothetical protein